MERREEVVIVGAGIAGLATAVGLKKVGVQALVLERAPQLRATGAAITLFPNAWRALHTLGVAHQLTSIYPPFTRAIIFDVGSQKEQQVPLDTPCDGEGLGVRSVHRKALLEALAEELPPGAIRFSSKLSSITYDQSSHPLLHLDDGTTIHAKVVIGCDGVHSVVARWLGLGAPVHSCRFAIRGMAVYPQGHGFPHQVYQFVNDAHRGGFVPLTSTDVYWFMVYQGPLHGDDQHVWKDPEMIQKDVLKNMARNFPQMYLDVVKHDDLTALTSGPLMFRYPWDLIFRNASKGNVTVAGDAMHPMTPDLGHGGCSALEDAVVLARHIGNIALKFEGTIPEILVEEALKEYVKERRWRVAGLILGAYLSGWVQQGGSSWFRKFLRVIFYLFVFRKILGIVNYDCGKLPTLSTKDKNN